MKTQLDFKDKKFDEHESRFIDGIKEYGWYAHHIFESEDWPQFSFTSGFWLQYGFPEIIVFAMEFDTAQLILGGVRDQLEDGVRFDIGVPVQNVLMNDVVFLPVDKKFYEDLGWTRWFYLVMTSNVSSLYGRHKRRSFPGVKVHHVSTWLLSLT